MSFEVVYPRKILLRKLKRNKEIRRGEGEVWSLMEEKKENIKKIGDLMREILSIFFFFWKIKRVKNAFDYWFETKQVFLSF